MELTYSIPGHLYWINNFLPEDLYNKIHNAVIKERKNYKTSWPAYAGIYTDLIPPKTTGFTHLESVIPSLHDSWVEMKRLVYNNPYLDIKDKFISSTTIYVMEKDAGITWHTDGLDKTRGDNDPTTAKWKQIAKKGWDYAATLYLNKRWDKRWGGELMYTNHKDIRGYIPFVGNSLVLIKTPLLHKVNTVLSPVLPRLSIQMFIREQTKKDNKDNEDSVEFINPFN